MLIEPESPPPARRSHDVPVLVVGAGPAGLTAATTLARYGVETLLVERRHRRSNLPRATSISTRPMELLRSWGLEDEILAGGVDVDWLGWICETLATASAGSAMPTGMPTREQSALVSPTAPACVPQGHLEPVLLRHLRSLGSTRVETGTELAAVESRPEGVRAVLRDSDSGESRVVQARYLIAADGVYSRTRAALGIPMHGPGHLADRVAAEFHAPLWDLLGDHRYGLYPVTTPEAPGTFLPSGPGDRWIFAAAWDPEHERLEDYDEEEMTRLIRLAAGVPALQPRIERISAVTFGAQLAERFRQDSAFLIGDAAHRVSPRGGTGMNTAIQDGHDLGWKLAWVLQGWAGEALLDSYEAERRPVAEHNTTRSADPNGSILEVGQGVHADLAGRIAHVWLPAETEPRSTLDLLDQGLTLFTGPGAEAWEAAAAALSGPLPLAVRSLDEMTARALGVRTGGALLVRPDGAPAGWLAGGDDALPALRVAIDAAVPRADTLRIGTPAPSPAPSLTPVAVALAWLSAFRNRDAGELLALTSPELEYKRWVGVEHGHAAIHALLERHSYGVTMDPTPLRAFARDDTVVIEVQIESSFVDTGAAAGEQVGAALFVVHDGAVTRFAPFPELAAALIAAGLDEDQHMTRKENSDVLA